jgi:hypothetical protein
MLIENGSAFVGLLKGKQITSFYLTARLKAMLGPVLRDKSVAECGWVCPCGEMDPGIGESPGEGHYCEWGCPVIGLRDGLFGNIRSVWLHLIKLPA